LLYPQCRRRRLPCKVYHILRFLLAGRLCSFRTKEIIRAAGTRKHQHFICSPFRHNIAPHTFLTARPNHAKLQRSSSRWEYFDVLLRWIWWHWQQAVWRQKYGVLRLICRKYWEEQCVRRWDQKRMVHYPLTSKHSFCLSLLSLTEEPSHRWSCLTIHSLFFRPSPHSMVYPDVMIGCST